MPEAPHLDVEGRVAGEVEVVLVDPDVARGARGADHVGVEAVVLGVARAQKAQVGEDDAARGLGRGARAVAPDGEAAEAEEGLAEPAVEGLVGPDHRVAQRQVAVVEAHVEELLQARCAGRDAAAPAPLLVVAALRFGAAERGEDGGVGAGEPVHADLEGLGEVVLVEDDPAVGLSRDRVEHLLLDGARVAGGDDDQLAVPRRIEAAERVLSVAHGAAEGAHEALDDLLVGLEPALAPVEIGIGGERNARGADGAGGQHRRRVGRRARLGRRARTGRCARAQRCAGHGERQITIGLLAVGATACGRVAGAVARRSVAR